MHKHLKCSWIWITMYLSHIEKPFCAQRYSGIDSAHSRLLIQFGSCSSNRSASWSLLDPSAGEESIWSSAQPLSVSKGFYFPHLSHWPSSLLLCHIGGYVRPKLMRSRLQSWFVSQKFNNGKAEDHLKFFLKALPWEY